MQKQKSYDLETWHVAGSQGELIVHLAPASVVIVVVNNVQTSSPLKPHTNQSQILCGAPWEGGKKVYINGPCHMTKMAAMPIYGKTFKNLSSPETEVL